jgi:riboflavin synthase
VFTGIIQEVGRIHRIDSHGGDNATDRRIEVAFGSLARDRLELGASIAVDGICLTVADVTSTAFVADVSGETLRVTTLGSRAPGDRVNLEPALRAGDSLGGHWVTGHIDGVAEVLSTRSEARSLVVELAAPAALARYIARKGSVTLDGVSLTVNEVEGVRFSINLIPHTQNVTTFGSLRVGQGLNLEIDLLARYVERLAEAESLKETVK